LIFLISHYSSPLAFYTFFTDDRHLTQKWDKVYDFRMVLLLMQVAYRSRFTEYPYFDAQKIKKESGESRFFSFYSLLVISIMDVGER